MKSKVALTLTIILLSFLNGYTQTLIKSYGDSILLKNIFRNSDTSVSVSSTFIPSYGFIYINTINSSTGAHIWSKGFQKPLFPSMQQRIKQNKSNKNLIVSQHYNNDNSLMFVKVSKNGINLDTIFHTEVNLFGPYDIGFAIINDDSILISQQNFHVSMNIGLSSFFGDYQSGITTSTGISESPVEEYTNNDFTSDYNTNNQLFLQTIPFDLLEGVPPNISSSFSGKKYVLFDRNFNTIYGSIVEDPQHYSSFITNNEFWMIKKSYFSSIELSKFNLEGDQIFTLLLYGITGEAIQLIELNNGDFLLSIKNEFSNIKSRIIQFNPDGIINGIKNLEEDIVRDIIQTENGHIYYITNHEVYRLDNLDDYGGSIKGNIYADLNENCSQNSNEPILQNRIVYLENEAITNYTQSDEQGNYEFPNLPSGDYTLTVVPNSIFWTSSLCSSNSLEVTLESDSTVHDFPLTPTQSCALMQVDISTPFLRRCFPNTYNVHYCNQGTEEAQDVYVEVYFDEFTTVDSASIPWVSENNNMYTFELGNYDWDSCGFFQIYTTLDSSCDSTILGQTHCVEAHIYPDTVCEPINGNWDGSQLEVSAICTETDSVIFTIENVGDGDMTDEADYIVVEDNVIMFNGTVQLGSGEGEQVAIEAFGQTYRLEADQVADYPVTSYPSVSIEGCGGFNNLGFVTVFAEDDASPFVSIDCQESIGSWDPNDKTAYPKGLSAEKYITNENELEYRIRFQNTGTDTAFNIVISDTLSPYLNPITIVPGASSHPYSFELYGSGIAQFTFNNIYLPDSNVNEPGSHGFVKFKIQQMENNTIGTVIENMASIYFDANEPVHTNTEFNTILDKSNILVRIEEVKTTPSISTNIYPNPSHDVVNIELLGTDETTSKKLQVYDISGKIIIEETYSGNTFLLDVRPLSLEIYSLNITHSEKSIIQAKLIIE